MTGGAGTWDDEIDVLDVSIRSFHLSRTPEGRRTDRFELDVFVI